MHTAGTRGALGHLWVLRLHRALVGSQIALLIGTLRFHLAAQGGGGLPPLTPPPPVDPPLDYTRSFNMHSVTYYNGGS